MAATRMEVVQTGLKLVRTTPGTYLYEIPADRKATAHVQNVYVKKAAFLGGPAPAEIDIVIRHG